MTKLYYQAPKSQVLTVRPDNEGGEYEFWLIEPVLIGTAYKQAEKAYICNGVSLTNLSACEAALLQSAGKEALISDRLHTKNRRGQKIVVSGKELVRDYNWKQFCKARKLDPDQFLEQPLKTYELEAAAAEALREE